MADEAARKFHEVSAAQPVKRLEVEAAFQALTPQEKLYAHHFSRASWLGAKVCVQQVSEESPKIFEMLMKLFRSCNDQSKFLDLKCEGVDDTSWTAFMAYCTAIFGNMGNYLCFGDSKLVPSVSRDVFARIVQHGAARASAADRDAILSLWDAVQSKVYSLEENEREFGFAPKGVSAYYSAGMTREHAELVGAFMQQRGIATENTRVFKVSDDAASVPHFELRIASAQTKPVETCEFEGAGGKCMVDIKYGDHADEMRGVADELAAALEHAANDTQRAMLDAYVKHFRGGDIDDHKQSQRMWVRDKGPVVETNIGFIETYRDPLGVRAEFEGMVAIVNKEMSKKFAALVDGAPELLKLMPWPPAFEKDHFLRPDFTSLEVLTFACSGVPAGINIPNYNDIRQDEGFKNVALGNVLSAAEGHERVPFLQDSDQELYRHYKARAFEVQVGCHELLGHGSGKLLVENEDGTFNFDRNLINPLTNERVATWYKPRETWDSKFGQVSSSFEECRAECTGIFMSAQKQVQDIFGFQGEEAAAVVYANWLDMVRKGAIALEFYSPATQQWRQAHMQARYAILRTLLTASAADTTSNGSAPLVQVKRIPSKGTEGDDIEVLLNRDKIDSVGVPAIAELLRKLNLYKAVADAEGGIAMYKELTTVDGEWLEIRDIVIARKKPRDVFVQAHTWLDESGDVQIKQFDASFEGMVQSFLARYN